MIRLLSFADLISLTNALFGFFSILILFSSFFDDINLKLHLSFSFILLGLLADGLDGIVARRFGKSKIGEYLEAMADMTTLVIAPAVFVYFVYISSGLFIGTFERSVYLLFALVFFVFFGFIRLASFSILKEKKIFIGLPASAGTIIILILSYIKINYLVILPAVIIISAAMASTIEFPKPNIYVNSTATVLIFLCIILGRAFYNIAPLVLLLAILIYAIGEPSVNFLTSKKQRKGF